MSSEHQALAQQVAAKFADRNLKLATAESCTGGGIAALVTDIPGSSQWFERGFVTYSNEAKRELLGVDIATLAEHGAASAAVALEMATGAISNSHADIAVSVTGIAGPDGGSEQKPVGSVWFGWADRNGNAHSDHMQFDGGRKSVRSQTVAHALTGAIRFAEQFEH